MRHKIFVLIAFLSFQFVFSQYTEIINSKRPGFSESPYGVGTNVFQVESGVFYLDNQIVNTFNTDNSLGANLFLRYGKFLEKLELNADISYQFDNRAFFNGFVSSTSKVNGISKLTFGAKYLIYNQKYTDKSKEIRSWKKRMAFDKKRLIPSVGIYVGINSNLLGKDFKEEGISAKGAVLLQNDISSRFVILTNLIVDNILQDNINYGYIVTATYAMDGKWSIFGENQGVLNKNISNELQFGTGVAYLLNNNIQLDASTRINFVGDATNFYVGLGGSWRLDRHIKQKKSEDVLKGEKKGTFFSRLFKKNKRPKARKVKTKKRRKSRAKKGTPSFHKKDGKKKRRGRGN